MFCKALIFLLSGFTVVATLRGQTGAVARLGDASSCYNSGIDHMQRQNFDSALYCFRRAIDEDSNKTDLSALCHIALGKSLFLTGNRNEAIVEVKKAIIPGGSNSIGCDANRLLSSINHKVSPPFKSNNFISLEPDWVSVEGVYISYNFEDTTGLSAAVNKYVVEHEQAYVSINKTFQAFPARKLQFFIWNDTRLGAKLLGSKVGFSSPEQYVCHVHWGQSPGHELTHILSYWGWGEQIKHEVPFISEGTAVAFSMWRKDKYPIAKNLFKLLRVKYPTYSVLDAWVDTAIYTDSLRSVALYAIGGVFVSYLLKISTPAQFKAIIQDQTINNARRVYGRYEFDRIIADFDKAMSL